MKLLMLLGGLVGFLIGLVFGLAQASAWPSILWRASVAAFAAGMLMRWWGRIWLTGLQQVAREQTFSQATPKTAARPTPTKS